VSTALLRVYSYSACGTCRKALQWLAHQGFSVEAGNLVLLDITLTPPSPTELRRALDALGRKRLFNTSGLSYRALGAATVASFSDEQALAALGGDGKLIRRPFAIAPDESPLVGFKVDEWSAALSD
jgi:arsenate reductase